MNTKIINLPTPHNNASKGDFAKTVLMPGDPLRSKYVAENFLENSILINNIRGIQGYTGIYKNKKISVMASGMGCPSIGIYSFELFNAFNVENIIRIGSAGALNKNIKLKDLVIAIGASTDSNFAQNFNMPGTIAPTASFDLLKKADYVVEKLNFKNKSHFGNVLTSDFFYNDDENDLLKWQKMNTLAVEMETAALYLTAARFGKHSLGIFSISDNIVTGKQISSQERETGFDDMIYTALEIAII